jgi:hypothetical protein
MTLKKLFGQELAYSVRLNSTLRRVPQDIIRIVDENIFNLIMKYGMSFPSILTSIIIYAKIK